MAELIYDDIYTSLALYGMGAIAVGTVAAAASWIYRAVKKNAHRCLYAAVMAGYLYILLNLTFLSRHIGQYGNINLTFFNVSSLFPMSDMVHYVENFIMLLPLGFLLPAGMKIFRYAATGLMIGFVVSFAIEITQLLTTLGTFAIDDIVMNGLGCAVGWMMWKMISLLVKVHT